MQRNSLLELAGRVFHGFARITLNKANDSPLWQELHADGFNSDSRTKIERLQDYGFTSHPLPRDQQQGKQASGAEGGEATKGPAAEGVCVYMGGQRNHPVCIGIDDRRHRPRAMKPGESAQYDDLGQMTILRRDGAYVLSLDTDGQTRKASLRHVEKQKQPKPQKQVSGKGVSQGQAQEADYKHEGETVNTEVIVFKDKVRVRVGDKTLCEVVKASRIVYMGGSPSEGDTFAKVMTETGASTNVYAKIG